MDGVLRKLEIQYKGGSREENPEVQKQNIEIGIVNKQLNQSVA